MYSMREVWLIIGAQLESVSQAELCSWLCDIYERCDLSQSVMLPLERKCWGRHLKKEAGIGTEQGFVRGLNLEQSSTLAA